MWLLSDDKSRCEFWMANVGGAFSGRDGIGGEQFARLRETMAAHLLADTEGWTRTLEYLGTIRGCRRRSANNHASIGVESLVVVPLLLPTGTLGWMALAAGAADACETGWRRALTEAVARQATMALHYSRLSEQAGSRSGARPCSRSAIASPVIFTTR